MEFTIKQKIIFVILTVILVVLGIYVYNIRFKEDFEIVNESENIFNITNNIVSNILDNNDGKENNVIVVHITGAVKKEGIVRLEEGSRICDAIEKAEGSLENADLSKINLAYILEDGQKIYVPYIGEIEKENEVIEYVTSDYGNDIVITEVNREGGNDKVNINIANQTELETLPGIGTATAEKIIEYRNKNGKFNNIEDIKNVKGIGQAKYENIKENICIK